MEICGLATKPTTVEANPEGGYNWTLETADGMLTINGYALTLEDARLAANHHKRLAIMGEYRRGEQE